MNEIRFCSQLDMLFCLESVKYFCESLVGQGCLVAPTLSIGSILLQQAAISASFHYNNVEIVESRANARVSLKCL